MKDQDPSTPINESTDQPGNYHTPVLLEETVNGLNIQPGGIYVDCTFGGGGHSIAILKQLDANGRLIAFDQDDDAKKICPMIAGFYSYHRISGIFNGF